MLLAMVLMFTLLPCSVFAEEGGTNPSDGEVNMAGDPNTAEETLPEDLEPPTDPNLPTDPVPPESPESNTDDEGSYPSIQMILENEDGKKLSGGKFVLRGADNGKDMEWVADEKGAFDLMCPYDGTYVLEQTEAPDWYELGAETRWEVTVSENGTLLALSRYTSDGQTELVTTAPADDPASYTVSHKRKLGALTVEKNVSYEKDGAAVETADWTASDEDEKYEITVTLSDEENTPFTETIGDVVFTEGTAVIALLETDSLTLSGIPYGYQYAIAPKTENTDVVCAVTAGDASIIDAETTATVSYKYRFVTRNAGLHVAWVNEENTAQPVTGGKLALQSADGNLLAECAADADGKLHFEITEEGTYTLTETETPAGYFSNSSKVEVVAVKEKKVVDGVTEEHMVIIADILEEAEGTEGVYLFKSAPIKPVTISVNGVWDVPEGFTATPKCMTVQLYRDGTPYGEPITLNKENNWKHSWSGAEYTNAYAWDVVQILAPIGYSKAVVSEDGYAFSVVNKLEYGDVTVSVSKSWLNPKDYKKQPSSVKVVLYRDGTAYQTVTLSESNGWAYRWIDLPNCFKWTVDEPTVPENYKKKISHVGNSWVIVNAHKDIPLTGDDSNIGLWAGVTSVAVVGLGVCAFLLLKKRKNDDE